VLIDLNYARDTTSGREGMDLISRIHALDPALPIVVMTAWGTVDLAVQAMRRGVCDFVQKPWDNRHLLQTLAKQVKHAQARRSFKTRWQLTGRGIRGCKESSSKPESYRKLVNDFCSVVAGF
jgi:FixJ family two-component response regulator